jgi:hypothetical protein
MRRCTPNGIHPVLPIYPATLLPCSVTASALVMNEAVSGRLVVALVHVWMSSKASPISGHVPWGESISHLRRPESHLPNLSLLVGRKPLPPLLYRLS